jgi:quercetin dioxygenase-like cupin family protein
VLNAREAPWYERDGRGFYCEFEGFEEHEPDFSQLGINLTVLRPGEPMAMYHWEADQEDFLVIAGEALLVVEGGERALRQWDLVHCPPGTEHVIIGAEKRRAAS